MICVYFGTDKEKAHAKFIAAQNLLQKKRPDAPLFSFEAGSWNEGAFDELIGAQTLFAGKSIVVSRGLFSTPTTRDAVTKKIKALAASENAFLFLEEKLLADQKTPLKKYAEKFEEFEGVKEEKKKDEKILYVLTDAIGARDRRSAWVAYQSALRQGIVPQQLFWKFVWQVRNMMMASFGAERPTPESVGMHSYPFGKASTSAKNYSKEELVNLHRRLLHIYHEDRLGKDGQYGYGDLSTGLERLTLEL